VEAGTRSVSPREKAMSLLSTQFLAVALAAVVLLSVFRGSVRQWAFLLLNLYFAGALLLGIGGAASTLLFALLGYLLTHAAVRWGTRGLSAGLILLVALFVWMRDYEFLHWLLPESLLTTALSTIGLSFLFFRIIHVMVDARAETLGHLDLLSYLNYCLNFATFMMGPIQRYQDFRAQWTGEKPALPAQFEPHLDAVLRVLVGLVKAYVLAGFFEARALKPDTDLLALSAKGLVVQTYAFWIYLYLNFSGYCDVVIGIGSLFGIRPPENFNRPWRARNISEFWTRQHRSLTLWLTDYVFTPLYRSFLTARWTARHKLLAVNLSLGATMLVSGLWHGTTLSFLLFGLVHGFWFIIYRTWDDVLVRTLGKAGARRVREYRLAQAVGIALTFNATAFAFIFFRSSPERVAQALVHLVTG
jgi:alginate O-acetyltransferase complex protein AlgI